MDRRRFFFFNDTATTEIYTLSLHDALPILTRRWLADSLPFAPTADQRAAMAVVDEELADRKSTRLNSSHAHISYAVFCLKKKLQRHRMSLLWLPALLPAQQLSLQSQLLHTA